MTEREYLNTLSDEALVAMMFHLTCELKACQLLTFLQSEHVISEEEEVRKRIEKLYIKEAGK